jgi:hypothetical protein
MCPAALLGDRASGKTTFLGALYAAEVMYGSDRKDTFRFFAPPDSLTLMSNIYTHMIGGDFPDATLKYEMNKVQFTFGFKTLVGSVLDRLKVHADSRFLHPWKGIRFAAYDVSGEDVQEYITSGVASSPIIKQLLESYVVVILVDCSRMTLDQKSPSFNRMVRYDGEIAKLIVNFATYKVQEYERQKASGKKPARLKIFPAIVLTKTDMIRPETLHQLGLATDIPKPRDSAERRTFCEELLRVFLPQTLSQLRGARVEQGGPSFDQSEYFASWIKTVTSDAGMAVAGPPKIQLKAPSAGTSAGMDFSIDEYFSFIEFFRKIADQVADYEGEDANSVAVSS